MTKRRPIDPDKSIIRTGYYHLLAYRAIRRRDRKKAVEYTKMAIECAWQAEKFIRTLRSKPNDDWPRASLA